MSIATLNRIYSELSEDKIDYKEAYKMIKALPKPWTTKEWKTIRNDIIKKRCDVCNSETGPFVLQHTRHPQDFSKVYEQISLHDLIKETEDFEKKLTEGIEIAIANEIENNFSMRDCCPECKVVNIRSRKAMTPKYVCVNNHSFENPISLKYYKNSQTTDLNIVRHKGLQILPEIVTYKMRREFADKNDLAIGKKALLMCISQSLEYWSFQYSKTACKKCSFLEDYHLINTKGIPYYYQ